jgi:hypothetical protein
MMIIFNESNLELLLFLSLRMFTSRFSLSITQPSRAAALIPVRLAFDPFENNTLPIALDNDHSQCIS